MSIADAVQEAYLAQNVEMMRDPDRWPQWPLLPLKRHVGAQLQSGFMHAADSTAKVYLKNIFDVRPGENLDRLPVTAYASLEETVKAGWRVD